MSTILGVIVAGGGSRRFGSDKADAAWRGHALLEHAVQALRPQVDELVVSGHDFPGLPRIEDRPPGVGPIGGLAAAIHCAAQRGHAGALCVPVDVHPLPGDLRQRLNGSHPAVFADQHMIGWWPATYAEAIDRFIAGGGRAVHDWIAKADARIALDPPGLVNVNAPADLGRLPR